MTAKISIFSCPEIKEALSLYSHGLKLINIFSPFIFWQKPQKGPSKKHQEMKNSTHIHTQNQERKPLGDFPLDI